LNPRTDTAHACGLTRLTSTPGASRNASGKLVAPDRRISSPVMM
jgi:hypothetical protein